MYNQTIALIIFTRHSHMRRLKKVDTITNQSVIFFIFLYMLFLNLSMRN